MVVEEVAETVGGGKWIVPWSSTSARPEGVWRRGGSGFSETDWGDARVWSGIDGIVEGGVGG